MQRLLFLVCLLNLQTISTADAAGFSKPDERVQTSTYVFHGAPYTGRCRFTLNPKIDNSYYFGLDPSTSSTDVCCGKFGLGKGLYVLKASFKQLVIMALKNDETSLASFIESQQGPDEKKVFLKGFLEELRLTSGSNNPENRKMLEDFTALNC